MQGVRVYVRSVLVYTEKGRPGDRDKSACRGKVSGCTREGMGLVRWDGGAGVPKKSTIF